MDRNERRHGRFRPTLSPRDVGVTALLGAGVGYGLTCDELAQACVPKMLPRLVYVHKWKSCVGQLGSGGVCYRMERIVEPWVWQSGFRSCLPRRRRYRDMSSSSDPRPEGMHRQLDTELVTQLEPVAHLLAPSQGMVVFTGAGISTESGIPDYRGPDGVWQTNRIPTAASVPTDAAGREVRWQQHRQRYPQLQAKTPNAGHLAIADLERHRRVRTIITQNIDGLHQKAGSAPERVLELHGSSHRLRCVACGQIHESAGIVARLERGERDPVCERCGGVLRSSTVLFGEPLPVETLRRAVVACTETDLMLVVGSSLVVKPAAQLPVVARKNGAMLVIINREPTPLDNLANAVVRGEAGPVLQTLADLVLRSEDGATSAATSGPNE